MPTLNGVFVLVSAASITEMQPRHALLTPNRYAKPMEQLEKAAMMAKCADVCVLKQAASVLANPTRRMTCASPQNRDAEPIKRSPNLKAVYLEKFKRSLAWAILPTIDTEYWQWLPKKPFRKSRKTA